MNVQFINEEEEHLGEQVSPENQLKSWIVNYVGNKKANEDSDEVTIDMVIETFGEEFPEFLLPIAEENWIRGYQQALTDVSIGEKLNNQENEKDADVEKNNS